MTALPFNPPKVAFVDSRGQVSREWLLWLQALWRISGAQAGIDSTALQAEIDALEAENDALQADVTALEGTVTVMQGQIEALKLPVGSVYVTVGSGNPATTLGYGTWAQIGAGRVLVGQDTGDADFDVIEETGGSKTVTL